MGLNPAGSPVPGVSPTVYATADAPESETVVVSALTRPLPWVTVHVTRACFTALPLKTPTVSGSGSDCPSGAPCWLPDTMAILVLSPGAPAAGAQRPAGRTTGVPDSRGCSAQGTVSASKNGVVTKRQ